MASAPKSERRRICPGRTESLPPENATETFQSLSLGLFRSDYMVHQETTNETPVIKQVEFNTIASSFGGLSSQTSNLHK